MHSPIYIHVLPMQMKQQLEEAIRELESSLLEVKKARLLAQMEAAHEVRTLPHTCIEQSVSDGSSCSQGGVLLVGRLWCQGSFGLKLVRG